MRTCTVPASAIVLATGRCRSTLGPDRNPPVSTGDGLAMAARFGAHVKDMAFVQFHPTTIEHPSRTFLIFPKPFVARGPSTAWMTKDWRVGGRLAMKTLHRTPSR